VKARHWASAGGGTTIAFVAIVVACAVAGGARFIGSAAIPVSGLAAVLTAMALCVTAACAPRFGTGAAIGAAFGLVPSVLSGTTWALSLPLATTHMRCGTADVGLPLLAAVAIFVGCVVAFPVSAMVNLAAPRLDRALSALAFAAVAAATVVVALGAASLRRPQPDDFGKLYDERLELDGGKTLTVAGVTYEYRTAGAEPNTCTLHISDAAGTRDEPLYAPGGACPALDVVRGPSLPAAVVRHGESVGETGVFALAGDGDVTVTGLRGRLGAPRGWVLCGALGLGFAALALGLGLHARRRVKVVRAAVEARHTGGGWVEVDGASRHVAALEHAPPGPVTVQLGAPRPATYRTGAAPDVLLVASAARADAIDTARAHVATWALVSVSVIAFTCAPLCAARLFGLL